MSETAPPYDPGTPPAGWYTLRYVGSAPTPPAWTVLTARLDAPGFILIFHLEHPEWLNADQAAAARSVPPPEGLALVYTEPPRG